MHYLYRITNRVNQKVYIGQTAKNPPSQRWANHCYEARQGKRHPLYHSINKYTRHNFRFEIIAWCKTQEDADVTEEILIKQYDSLNRDKGYNLVPGGLHNMKGFHHSEETKQLWSEQRKGRHFSTDTEFKSGRILAPEIETKRLQALKENGVWNKGISTPIKLTLEQIVEIQTSNLSTKQLMEIYNMSKSNINYHKSKARKAG